MHTCARMGPNVQTSTSPLTSQVLSQDSSSELMAYRLRDVFGAGQLAAVARGADDDAETYEASSVAADEDPLRTPGASMLHMVALLAAHQTCMNLGICFDM